MKKEEAKDKMRDSMGNWGLTQEFWEDVDKILESHAIAYAQFIQDYWPDYRADTYYDEWLTQNKDK